MKKENSKFKRFLCLFIVIFSCFLFFSVKMYAATLYFSSAEKNIGINGELEVSVFLDTEGEQINAIEGLIVFPNDVIEIIDINDGGSIIDVWIQKPILTQEGIIFSGITPGGFGGVYEPLKLQQKPGKVLTFILKGKKPGTAPIVMKNALTLLNNSEGSEAQVSLLPLSINVLDYQGVLIKGKSLDVDLPEEFLPEIVQDPNMFDGKYFLIFHTQDKGSGVDHYEIMEQEKWITKESPYVLEDQSLQSVIKVKAIDNSGNERIVELPATYPQKPWYQNYLWGIILLSVFLLFVIKKNYFR
jgi:hypothetical protein